MIAVLNIKQQQHNNNEKPECEYSMLFIADEFFSLVSKIYLLPRHFRREYIKYFQNKPGAHIREYC